jgi:hypothetical protein
MVCYATARLLMADKLLSVCSNRWRLQPLGTTSATVLTIWSLRLRFVRRVFTPEVVLWRNRAPVLPGTVAWAGMLLLLKQHYGAGFPASTCALAYYRTMFKPFVSNTVAIQMRSSRSRWCRDSSLSPANFARHP